MIEDARRITPPSARDWAVFRYGVISEAVNPVAGQKISQILTRQAAKIHQLPDGVQRRYKRQYENQQEFVDAIVKFVSQPTEDGALMKHPIKKLGLMPALPLGDDNLSKIATYIYEENFEPPCDHWANAISSEKGKGKHRKKVQSNYDELCK